MKLWNFKKMAFQVTMTWPWMAQSKVFVVQRNICETMGIEIVQDTAKKISGGCMTFHNGLCTEPLR
jgi:hypothetical protein